MNTHKKVFWTIAALATTLVYTKLSVGGQQEIHGCFHRSFEELYVRTPTGERFYLEGSAKIINKLVSEKSATDSYNVDVPVKVEGKVVRGGKYGHMGQLANKINFERIEVVSDPNICKRI